MSTTQLTIRIPDKVFRNIKQSAAEANLTMTDYIISKADSSYLEEENILQIDSILKEIDLVPEGELFSLKSLYDEDKWIKFSRGSRIATGRLFFKYYNENIDNLKNKIKFIGKNSANLAQYKKITTIN
jgi:hypothetical protein